MGTQQLKNSDICDYFQESLSKLPDLERMINRIYNLSDQKRLSAYRVEDFALNRLKEFLQFLTQLKRVEKIVEEDYAIKFKSKRLRQLCSFREVDIQSFNEKKKTKKSSKE